MRHFIHAKYVTVKKQKQVHFLQSLHAGVKDNNASKYYNRTCKALWEDRKKKKSDLGEVRKVAVKEK